MKELQKNNALPFRYAKMGRWTGKTTVRSDNAAAGFHYALFSESGFDEKITAEAERGDLILYPLETIVNYRYITEKKTLAERNIPPAP